MDEVESLLSGVRVAVSCNFEPAKTQFFVNCRTRRVRR